VHTQWRYQSESAGIDRAQYILPKQTHPFPRKTVPAGSQQAKDKTITATIKPMRGGEAITVSDLTLNSTLHDVKTKYAQQSGQHQDKIKILYNKKPAADLKSLKDLGVTEDTVELSVMIMAGGSTPSAGTPAVASPVAEKSEPAMSVPTVPTVPTLPESTGGDAIEVDNEAPAPDSEKAQAEAEAKSEGQASGADEILETEEFWNDLQGFLGQRLRDEQEGRRLTGIFREAHGKR